MLFIQIPPDTRTPAKVFDWTDEAPPLKRQKANKTAPRVGTPGELRRARGQPVPNGEGSLGPDVRKALGSQLREGQSKGWREQRAARPEDRREAGTREH